VPRPGRELWYALATIAAITALYAFAASQADALPAASSLIGHGIGVAGFVLMLLTATLYSVRKLRTDARWGSTASWLRFHMVTGLVGPYMVLLHTALHFSGLAGLTTVLMVAVVISGLVGRFIYTRLQRSSAGGVTAPRRALATWHLVHLPLTWALFAAAFVHVAAALYYATLQR
jgi:cytochrome b561